MHSPTRRLVAPLLTTTALVATACLVPPTAAAAAPSGAPAQITTQRVTLVTGDVVTLRTLPGETNPAITLDPTGPSQGAAQITREGDATYVVPLAANEAVASNAVDLKLFDVAGLLNSEYDDAHTNVVPLLLDNRSGSAEPVAPTGAKVKSHLRSIRGIGARLAKSNAAAFWRANDSVADRTANRVGKIWLDAKVNVTLADSVPSIGAPTLWQSGIDGKGVKIAVLDTGVDTTHPDLKGRVSVAKNFTDAAEVTDHFGHGTHVAATIGGSGTGNGAQGVAPGADLISGKVLDDTGSGTYSSILDGMQWAAESGAAIVNMSLGSSSPDDGQGPLSAAVNRLSEQYGTLFVVAAGNAGPNRLGEPASATEALTVGAVSTTGTLASFSSTGPRIGDWAVKPELTGPGVDIVAARAVGTTMGTPVDDLYTKASGTSMATPHVAGAAALLKEAHPAWTATQLKTALINSTDAGDYRADQGGSGKINIPRASGQQASATPATLDLGGIRYAEDGSYQPVTREITIHNDADQERTFTVTASGVAAKGGSLPAGTLSVDKPSVTLAVGSSATVTLSFNPNGLAREALYSGFVTAVATDSTASLRVPFNVYLEPVLRAIKVTGFDTRGAQAGGPSQVLVSPVTGAGITRVPFRGGVAAARVKPGKYIIIATIYTPDASGSWIDSAAGGFLPAVDVQQVDAAVTLDASKASRFTVDTGRRTELYGSAFGYLRTAGGGYQDVMTLVAPTVKDIRLFPSARYLLRGP